MIKKLKKIAAITAATAYLTTAALAIDDGPRMYWNLPQDLNVLQTYAWNVNGNMLNYTGAVSNPDLNVNINVLLFGYNRVSSIAGHTAIYTVILPVGNADASLQDTIPVAGVNVPINREQTSRGIGDIYLQGTFNLIGGEAVSMEEYMTTYKQSTLLSVLVGLSTPTGEYNGHQSVNMGLNRWAGRIAFPFVQTLGDWKPGEITTLEITPGVWFYGDNDDYLNGRTLKQDPLYTIETHLTRDLTPTAFVSLDYMYQTGGETQVVGARGTTAKSDAQNIDTLGLSIGYMFNPSTQFVFRYNAALSPKSDELDMGIMEFNLNYLF